MPTARYLITGVLSNRSIAYGVAKACHREGATLAFTYASDELKDRVDEDRRRIRSVPRACVRCDVRRTDCETVRSLRTEWQGLDGLLHSIAFAPREALSGDFLEALSRSAFATAHDVSSYSFAALAKAARPLLAGRHASLVDAHLPRRRACAAELQRDGAREGEPRGERALPRDGLGPEGTRVNAISAGPIKTLAAAGIGGFSKILHFVEQTRRCAAT